MFSPALPLTGLAGWSLLQRTMPKQIQAMANSSNIKNDISYFKEKMATPISLDAFLQDKRLLRIGLTAHGLDGEEWKGGFLRKVLTEAVDPESTFLKRLNNSGYTNFAKSFLPIAGEVFPNQSELNKLMDNYVIQSFQLAVGETDNSMRLSLTFQSEIEELIGQGKSDETILFSILGSVPIRTVLQGALNLPSELTKLDLDKQSLILKEKLSSVFNINKLDELKQPEKYETIIRRFHALEQANLGPSSATKGFVGLSLLQANSGSQSAQNIFLSLL